jgi:WD40 repeat protein
MDNGYFNVYSHDLKELDSVSAHDDIVSGLSFSVNTSHFYSCGWDGAIIVWDIADYKEPLYVIQDAHSSAVYDISSHPSQGNIFVSVGYDGFCRLWDVRQGKDAFNLVNVGQIASSVTFTSDLYLSCGLVDGMIKQFDIRDLTEPSSQLKLEGNIRRLETPQQFPSKLIASTGNMECCILNTDPILSVIHRYIYASAYISSKEEIFNNDVSRYVGHTDFVNDFVLVSNLEGNEDKLYTVSVDGELHCSSVHK